MHVQDIQKTTTLEMVHKIRDLDLEERRVKVRELEEVEGTSPERVFHILRNELVIKKPFAI